MDNVSHFLFDSFRHSPEPERLKNKLKLSGRCCAFSANSNVQSMPQLPSSDRDFKVKQCSDMGDGRKRRRRRKKRAGKERRKVGKGVKAKGKIEGMVRL